MLPSHIQFRSLSQHSRNTAAPKAAHWLTTGRKRAELRLAIAALVTIAGWLSYAAIASAAERRCSIVIINGDTVITCPKGAR